MRHSSMQEQLEEVRHEMQNTEHHPHTSSNQKREVLKVKSRSQDPFSQESDMTQAAVQPFMNSAVTGAASSRMKPKPGEEDEIELMGDDALRFKNSLGEQTVTITPEQKDKIVNNIIEGQEASIKEKKGNFYVSVSLMFLTAMFSGVLAAGLYSAMTGKMDDNKK
jgi:hypothetical protein